MLPAVAVEAKSKMSRNYYSNNNFGQLIPSLSFLAVSMMLLSGGISLAYADTLPLPQLSDENVTGVNVYTSFQSDNRWTTVIEVQYQVTSPLEVPETITYFSIDGTQTEVIPVRDQFIEANTPVIITPETLTEEEQKQIDIQNRLEENEKKQQEIRDQKLDKALTCLYGQTEDGTITWQAERETLKLQKTTYFHQLPADYQLKQLELWTEECKIKENYWATSHPYFTNKALTEAVEIDWPLGLDETDAPWTVDVTPEMLQAEAIRAENIPKHWNDPYQGFTGAELNPPEGPRNTCQPVHWSIDERGEFCPLQDYAKYDYLDRNPVDQVELAMIQMCEAYLPAPDAAHYKTAWENRQAILQHCPFVGVSDE